MKKKIFNRIAMQEMLLEKLPKEEIERNKKIMFETSDPLEKIPTGKLYHATSTRNFSSIQEKGLLMNPVWGEVYLVDKMNDAKKFADKPCIVFEIDSSQLDMERMKQSKDHDKRHYKCEAYQYYADIPPSAIIGFKTFTK